MPLEEKPRSDLISLHYLRALAVVLTTLALCFTPDCRALLKDGEWRGMEHVRICGLMMMATNTDDEAQVAREFQTASDFFDEVKRDYFADDDDFCQRSWGMSDDYPIAVRHGSTMVRVGTMIFGRRES